MDRQLVDDRTPYVHCHGRTMASLMSSATSNYADSDMTSTCGGMDSTPSVSTAPHDPNGDNPIYPCYMREYLECEAGFRSGQEEAWFEHVCDHMNHLFPVKTGCIFCDATFPASSMTPDDRKAAFHRRMMHIARHFRRWREEQLESWNLDRLMLNHLLHHGIVGQWVADLAERVDRPEPAEEPLESGPMVTQGGARAQRATGSEDVEITQTCEFARGPHSRNKKPLKQGSALEYFV
ncbi:uncharacterized protein F5Z01DRAFT_482313 [Emericellopsis atlantica]|uniref:Uncharacterized protein n=1 Tax=Emericellopsis atlantica TaxID=2614577 RepID=A0A9P7ZRW5_9HYPO|nr:uncharacterized protein F5Z01DRAFT_482313 [Emericellopsis atlantica]KAG9256682.1 hypothetical protein F5Z01DRAFT_482313 [Emericellopsis atlantica]